MARIPGIFDSGPISSTSNCCVLFVRWLQGFVTNPPNPADGNVIWKILSVSGKDRYAS